MSMAERKDALLEGWGEPGFPPEMVELDQALAAAGHRVAFGLSGGFLNECARQIRGFVDGSSGPVTSDGYHWFWWTEWALPTGRVRLLIPSRQDDSGEDNSRSDRSPAVYLQGGAHMRTARSVLRQFIGYTKTTRP